MGQSGPKHWEFVVLQLTPSEARLYISPSEAASDSATAPSVGPIMRTSFAGARALSQSRPRAIR